MSKHSMGIRPCYIFSQTGEAIPQVNISRLTFKPDLNLLIHDMPPQDVATIVLNIAPSDSVAWTVDRSSGSVRILDRQ